LGLVRDPSRSSNPGKLTGRISDYATTLREWRDRFADRFDSSIVPALKAAYGLKSPRDIEAFRRKWICRSCPAHANRLTRVADYFEYSAAGFASRALGTHIFTLTREASCPFSF
jgi:hypothetical protein